MDIEPYKRPYKALIVLPINIALQSNNCFLIDY